MKIAIIGLGYVGSAYKRFLEERYDIVWYDPNKEESATKSEINASDAAIICVPTNQKKDGSCDTSIVKETIEWLKVPEILVKSTVPPGTCQGDNVVFSPEFLGESSYNIPEKYPHPTDVKKHHFVIFGGKHSNFWVDVFQPLLGPDCRYYQTDTKTAEMVKYMQNSFGATKVTFFNEFYEICQKFGVDFNEARELLLNNTMISRMHTCVFPNDRGYSGKCFPKDISAIVKASEKAGYDPTLLKQVIKSNEKFRQI